ncbi:MAG: tetratricopeptide repeat protein [Candidatus Hydrogenedentes bacterium]|nr:tetratricopeptide repeat protein [Candidatus Hydrogenedentota bacterium]
MDAAKVGDHEVALDQIGRYLQRFGLDTDVEAMLEYAKARREVPLPNGKHFEQTISHLRQILSIQPDNSDAQRELVGVYSDIGYGVETISLAEDILAKKPDDVDALKARAKAYMRMQKYDAALGDAKKVAALEPADVENHILALSVIRSMKKPVDEILRYPDTVPGFDRGSAEYHIVQAIAHEFAGKRDETVDWTKRAAAIPVTNSTNTKTVELIDNLLSRLSVFSGDRFELQRLNLDMLAKSAGRFSEIELKRLLMRRLFESGNTRAVVKLMDQVPADVGDSEMLGILGLTHVKLEKWEQVKGVVEHLEKRDDRAAIAWREILSVFYLDKEIPARDLVENCKKYAELDGRNPYFTYYLGRAYERNGESDLALRTCSLAAQMSPLWGEPLLLAAQVLSARGNVTAATALAQQALFRSPQDVYLAAAAAEIPGVDLELLSDAERSRLWDLVEKIQSIRPMEPRTLPLLIEFLARRGDTTLAGEKLGAALAGEEALPEPTVLRLARISRDFSLGQTDACYAYALRSFGSTPNLALEQALAANAEGDPQRGLELLTGAAKVAGEGPDWKFAIAQYLERSGSAEAALAWSDYVTSVEPKNAMVLTRVLESEAAWENAALIDSSISALKELTGESGYTWRTARARWLLQNDHSEKAAAEAVVLLQDTSTAAGFLDIKQYLLIATALERIGNSEGALSNLQNAVRLAPKNNSARLDLARILYSRGDISRAYDELAAILANGEVSDRASHEVSAMVAAQEGRYAAAIEKLLAANPKRGDGPPADLLLAELYRMNDDLPNAQEIAKTLIEDNPSIAEVVFALDLFGSLGKLDEAKAAFDVLGQLQLDSGAREVLEAEFHGYYGNADDADRLFRAAIEGNKANPNAWRKYLAFLMRSGNVSAALDLAEEALAACPSEALFRAMRRDRALFEELVTRFLAMPIMISGVEDAGRFDAAKETLEVLNETPQDDPLRRVEQFRQLIQAHPTYLPVRMLLVRLLGQAGKHDEAAEVAAQAQLDFPTDVEPAELASESFAAAGRWVESFEAAGEAFRRSRSLPNAGDLLDVAAKQRIGRLLGRNRATMPYLVADKTSQDADGQSEAARTQSLLMANRVDDVASLLSPKLQSSTASRMLWACIATFRLPNEMDSAGWLERVTPFIPQNATEERTVLALSWQALAMRTGNEKYRAKAREELETVVRLPAAKPEAFVALASIAEGERDYALAEVNYQNALERDANLTAAQIGLARSFCEQGKRLDEAVSLAQKAVTTEPKNARCYATLARAYGATGDQASAIKYLTQAIDLEPSELHWRTELREIQNAKTGTETTKEGRDSSLARGDSAQ